MNIQYVLCFFLVTLHPKTINAKPMKKKILFCMFNMTGGGAERVLVNLFHELPPESYDITLFSLFGAGANMGA